MTNSVTKDFLTGVNEILTTTREQDLLFQSLRQYRSDDDLDGLISALFALIISPDRLALFDAVRPLIPAQHQLQFDRKTHRLASRLRVRVVCLSLRQGPLGFAFRGGLEHGVGCFVSVVAPKSAAADAGLRPGDEILRVNGFPVGRATHEEVAALIGARPDLKLKVKRVGMVPERRKASDPVSWEFSAVTCSDADPMMAFDDLDAGGGGGGDGGGEELHLFLDARGASLGCTIVSGPARHPGIFVHSVTPGGLAEQAGLREGDQLVQVNGVAFGADISHSHAVMVLKSPAGVHMTIRRGEGLELLAQRKQESRSPQHTPQRPQQLSSSEVQVHVKRQRSGEQSPLKSPSSAGTVTPKNEEGYNANVFFRTRAGESPQKQQQQVLEAPNFSSREAGGRFVESVRLSSRGGGKPADCGLELEEVPGGQIAVAGVEYGSLAFKADARHGDYLLAIDSSRVSGLRLPQVLELLRRAEQKTEFVLTLARAPAGIFNDEITYF